MHEAKYRMSFSTGGLYYRESTAIVPLYFALGSWKEVLEHSVEENIFQTRTNSTALRVGREAILRLKTLSVNELKLIENGSPQEQKCMLWVAVCRCYSFIREFALEVLREAFLAFRGVLNAEDFNYFFNKKADINQGLDSIADSTKTKLRQVLFRILREAELITQDNIINPTILTPDFSAAISKKDTDDLLLFPIFEADIRAVRP